MSRKISDFFNKKSIKIDACEEKSKIVSTNINDKISVKLELEEVFPNLMEASAKNLQNSTSDNNSGQENKSKINNNVKTEAEKQLLVILPPQKIHKHPVPVKIKNKKQKTKNNLCEVCQKTFSTLWHLKKHQKVHKNEQKCKYCEKIFRYNCLMLNHVKNIHENPGSFKCDICKVGFNSKMNLDSHRKVHMKNRPKPFKCNKCDYSTDIKSSFNGHLKTHERIIKRCDKCNKILYNYINHDCRLDCKFCGKKFNQREGVLNHIKKDHVYETERLFYECDICGFKVKHKKFLMNHIDSKHADGKIQTFTCDLDGKTFKLKEKIVQHMKIHLPPVKCDFCHIKVNIRNLKGHIKNSHTGIKQPRKKSIPKTIKIFQCPICFKILSTKSILDRHVSEHNKTIKCKFCDKLFGNQSRLKIHIKNYHENPEGHVCNICGKKFHRPDYLRNHLKTHDPNRPRDQKCTQCDFATFEKSALKIHLNSHKRKNAEIAAMENPHRCPQCPSVLKSKTALNNHMIVVHPKDLFECDICGKKTKTKSDILRHLRKIHKIGLNVIANQIQG